MNSPAIVGRGVTEGARMFREWFASLTEAPQRGRPAAYVFVMGSFNELLLAFDMAPVFPEINSLQMAVRRVAHEYLNEAEDYGYSPDICGYVKADVALQLRKGRHPMGVIPKPDVAILTNACNTYLKWGEIWERMHGTPVVTVDIPGSRASGRQTWPGDPDFERDRIYVERQIRELIAVLERVAKKKFDVDRLRETMGHANAMSRSFKQLIELNRSTPAVFNAVSEGTVYLGVANGFRGTAAGAAYFRDLVEEMSYKAANGLGTINEEKHRLVFVGVPCYPIFRRFNELFSEWGGAFVSSTYLWFASGGAGLGWQYDLSRPIESLAEGALIGVRHAMDCMFFQDRALIDLIDPYRVDGVVFHGIKSCRTTSTGLSDTRRVLGERRDIPSLLLESDMMDRRVVSEAQMKNRVDAFFEGLASRKLARTSA
ncbi:MAG TPA: 2-hydroxyacyl-CoA dehydratase family protein [Vicinamibacterales bacterium]|nr:2-hydroxyacyl-CoA dehydratase family protein [Vicinamibacterales bacterium]